MPNLAFASLRGTRTAINCVTKSEAGQVEKICGFINIGNNWESYGQDFCVDTDDESIRLNGEFANIEFYQNRHYTIIPAADFIAANSGEVETPKSELPAVDWSKMILNDLRRLDMDFGVDAKRPHYERP